MSTLFGDADRMRRDACLSACGRYRWSLSRCWDDDLLKPWVGFVMLNPSTADAIADDPTIRRCIGFAKTWGFAGLAVRNLFAIRSTDPDALRSVDFLGVDRIGSENDAAILDLVGVCPVIVAAWGAHGGLLDRDLDVVRLLAGAGVELRCLGTTQDGHPRHPLYVPGSTPLVPFTPRAA